MESTTRISHLETARRALKENIAIKERLLTQHLPLITRMALCISQALQNGGCLYLCGNGGSLADAQHLAAELLIRLRSQVNRQALPALCLATDMSSVTACGNDYGFEEIFARSLEGLANARDVLCVLSTSGTSPNVVKALQQAQHMGMITLGLLGGTGGTAQALCTHALIVPTHKAARAQEAHITIGHILMEVLEDDLIATGYLQIR